jgi:hypothetical protein
MSVKVFGYALLGGLLPCLQRSQADEVTFDSLKRALGKN